MNSTGVRGIRRESLRAAGGLTKGVVMEKWKCIVCGYVYDPADGDPDNGVEPGTSFGDLPDDWVCPDCGAPRSEFEKMA